MSTRTKYFQCTLTSKDGKKAFQGNGWTEKQAESAALKRAGGKKSDYESKTRPMVGPQPRTLPKKGKKK